MSQYSDQCKCGVCDEVRRLRVENARLNEVIGGILNVLLPPAVPAVDAWEKNLCSAEFPFGGGRCELPKHHAGVHRCENVKPQVQW